VLGGFRGLEHTHDKGAAAEEQAAAWLTGQGYRIQARNVRNPGGEIDVVALDGETLCFIEVRAKATPTHGPALESVSPAKQKKISRAAALYLTRVRHQGPCRFDVLGLDLGPDGWEFTLVRNAFEARF